MRKPLFTTICLAVALAAGPGCFARADDDHERDARKHSERDEREERDLILDAVRKGAIQPLPRLKAMVLERWPGELVALSIDTEDGRILYEFRILRANGRLTEVEVDAADGTILEVENE